MRERRRAEVVAVGTELLLGDLVDSNSAWISQQLADIGVTVGRHTTVGDDLDEIVSALREACGRAQAVIVTGGLGPTQDDRTRVAVARLADVPLERRADLAGQIEAVFTRRGRAMPPNNLLQADLPAGAVPLPPVGTAPGFVIQLDGTVVACVPGVPSEMRTMITRDVIPELARRFGLAATVSRVVRTAGIAESAVAETCDELVSRLERRGNPAVAFLASAGETRVRVSATAQSRDEALALCDPVVAELVQLLGPHVTGVDDEGVEAAIGRRLRSRGWTLAVAESVTGGGVGARLVSVPGASDWFAGGLVTYTNSAKTELAGLDAGVLASFGPVSEQVAAALASGAAVRLRAVVGLAVVGVAGPTTQGGQPVGTVCLGVALPGGEVRSRRLQVPAPDRVSVQQFAASAALDYLRRRLAEQG